MEPPELYHPDILALAKDTSHWRKEHDAQHLIKAYNPVCGDKFEIRFDINGIIENTSFFGYGCVVSKASIAVLCEMIDGKDMNAARAIVDGFLGFLNSDDLTISIDQRLEAFMIARKFPGRMQCVKLGWEAVMRNEIFSSKY